jgi:hypothetical protein
MKTDLLPYIIIQINIPKWKPNCLLFTGTYSAFRISDAAIACGEKKTAGPAASANLLWLRELPG